MSAVRDWLRNRGWSITKLHELVNEKLAALGHEPVEYEHVRRWTLPPTDKLSRVPGRVAMAVLRELTEGALDANVFYPPLSLPPGESVSQETLHTGG